MHQLDKSQGLSRFWWKLYSYYEKSTTLGGEECKRSPRDDIYLPTIFFQAAHLKDVYISLLLTLQFICTVEFNHMYDDISYEHC